MGLTHALFIVVFNRWRKRKRKRGEKKTVKQPQIYSKQNSFFTSASDAATESEKKLWSLMNEH